MGLPPVAAGLRHSLGIPFGRPRLRGGAQRALYDDANPSPRPRLRRRPRTERARLAGDRGLATKDAQRSGVQAIQDCRRTLTLFQPSWCNRCIAFPCRSSVRGVAPPKVFPSMLGKAVCVATECCSPCRSDARTRRQLTFVSASWAGPPLRRNPIFAGRAHVRRRPPPGSRWCPHPWSLAAAVAWGGGAPLCSWPPPAATPATSVPQCRRNHYPDEETRHGLIGIA